MIYETLITMTYICTKVPYYPKRKKFEVPITARIRLALASAEEAPIALSSVQIYNVAFMINYVQLNILQPNRNNPLCYLNHLHCYELAINSIRLKSKLLYRVDTISKTLTSFNLSVFSKESFSHSSSNCFSYTRKKERKCEFPC